MSSAAADIADFLETSGVGTVGSNIFIGNVPDTVNAPEASIGVFDTGAIFISPKWQRDEMLVQILVRGPEGDYPTGYNTAKSVQDALLGIDPQTINGRSYVLFVMQGGINNLGADQRDRHRFSLNFKIVRENVSGGVRDSF